MKNWMKNKKENGFTIMETLVAIFIILLAITGPMVFAQNGLKTAFIARDQITAFYLAQDAIEYVKNVKDDNGLKYFKDPSQHPSSWLEGLDDCIVDPYNPDNKCTIDTFNNNIKNCNDGPLEPGCFGEADNGSQDVPLKINVNGGDEDGLMGFGGEQDSIFAREIQIKEIQDEIEAEVIVKIRWRTNEGLGYREIIVQENMTNWIGAWAQI